jgi:uncharacterized protein YeaO (DUF488 family)
MPHPFRINVKRVYEPPSSEDGMRILVDRLWPRGLRKDEARIDLWLKEIAPSTALRKWFGHNPERWEEFRRRYREELRRNIPALAELRELTAKHNVTLIFSAHDLAHNNALVLRDMLLEQSEAV